MFEVSSNSPQESGKSPAVSSIRSNKVSRPGLPKIVVGLVSNETNSLHHSPVSHALIAIAQEVAELLKRSYSVQANEIDSREL
jgi:hypothetical protein